jgi:hypothetical protein
MRGSTQRHDRHKRDKSSDHFHRAAGDTVHGSRQPDSESAKPADHPRRPPTSRGIFRPLFFNALQQRANCRFKQRKQFHHSSKDNHCRGTFILAGHHIDAHPQFFYGLVGYSKEKRKLIVNFRPQIHESNQPFGQSSIKSSDSFKALTPPSHPTNWRRKTRRSCSLGSRRNGN